jgi:hypothetical protein
MKIRFSVDGLEDHNVTCECSSGHTHLQKDMAQSLLSESDSDRWVCCICGQYFTEPIDYCYDCNHHRCDNCRSVS